MRLVYEPLTDIPANFTEVEYLESSGTQYIDTGYIASNTSGFKIDIMPLQATDKYFIGSRPRLNSDDRFLAGSNTGPQVYIGWNTNNFVNWTLNNVHTVQNNFMNSRTKVLDGTTIAQITSDLLSQGTRTVYLFSANDANAVSMDTCRIYKVQISEGSVIVRDFVPCLDNNNVPCMYDKVSGQAFYNAGTGSFTYGRKIIPVEYLESSGTQYIDTGIKGKSGISAKTKVNYSYLSGTASHAIGGEYTSNTSCYFGMVRANGHFTYLYKNSVVETTTTLSTNTDYDIDITLNNGNQRFVINGNVVSTGTVSGDFTSTNNLFLYAINSVNGADVFGSLKMYYMKIYENNTLSRDYIPCKDENNVGFMFDRVTHTAYLNAGTGSFTFGKVMPKKKLRLIRESKRRLPKGFKEVEYLESTGTQYIDTGFKMEDLKTMTFEGNMMWKSSNGNANFFYGYRSVNSAEYRGDMRAFFVYGDSAPPAGRLAIRYGVNTDNSTSTISKNTIYKISFNGTDLKINDTTFISLSEAYTPANYKNMWLFNCNTTGYYSADVSKFSGRIYYWKIWSGGVLVRDFIPCLDASNIPCMYDLVEGKAYYNQGTGSFTYGKQIIVIEYLQTNSTAYIDTGIKGDLTTEIESVASVITTGQNGVTNIAGNNKDNTKAITINVACPNPAQAESRIRFSNTSTVIPAGTIPLNSYYKYTTNKNTFTALDSSGSVVFTYNFNATTAFETTGNLCIGRLDDAGPQYIGTVRHKELKIKKSGVLVRDYIPVKDENNVGYMFDKVNHTLYANAGTGSFVVGNEIKQDITRFVKDDVPNIYRKVSYLESSGTQYIDTGIIPTNTHGISINFSFSSNESFDGSWCPIGARTGDIRFWINKSVDASGLTFGFGDYTTSRQTQPKNTLLRASLNLYNNRKMIYVNGNYQENITSSISNLSNTLYIFGANVNGSISFVPPDCRIYEAQITNGSALVRDFVPVVRKSDNKPGMYDRVSKQFFTNAGTGEFIIPT